MASQRTYPLPPEEMAKALRQLRRVRQFASWTIPGPWVIIGLMVLVHRVIVPGVLDPFLDSPPWPYRFFSALFYLWCAGLLSLFVMKAFVCPNCGNGFTVLQGFNPNFADLDRRTGFRINVFSRRCVNCGLSTGGELPATRGGGRAGRARP